MSDGQRVSWKAQGRLCGKGAHGYWLRSQCKIPKNVQRKLRPDAGTRVQIGSWSKGNQLERSILSQTSWRSQVGTHRSSPGIDERCLPRNGQMAPSHIPVFGRDSSSPWQRGLSGLAQGQDDQVRAGSADSWASWGGKDR